MNVASPTLLRKFINLLLYGNFWIALAALSLIGHTSFIFRGQFVLDALVGFSFFGTLCLYAIHRIIGMSKAHEYFQLNRYTVITRYKFHIELYAVLGAIGAGLCFLFLKSNTQLAVVIPSLLSLAYVLPIFGNKKRLRDLDDIKIFLVAGVWAWITVILPAVEYELLPYRGIVLCFIERTLFVFAITLPFDIRDLSVDGQTQVKTIPGRIGIYKSKILSAFCLLGAMSIAIVCWWEFYYTFPILVALVVLYLFTLGLIILTKQERSDYFFTGWLDGTMVLSGVLVGIASYYF